MGLVDFRRGRTLDADPQGERRNGNSSIVDDSKATPALIGQALVELVALVVAELKAREDPDGGNRGNQTGTKSASDDSHDHAGSHDGAEQKNKKPKE